MILKKRSIDGYVSIFQNHFRSRCAKYGFSVNVVNRYKEITMIQHVRQDTPQRP